MNDIKNIDLMVGFLKKCQRKLSNAKIARAVNVAPSSISKRKKLFGIQFHELSNFSQNQDCYLLLDFVLISREMKIVDFPYCLTYNYIHKKKEPCLVILFAALVIRDKTYPITFDFWVDELMYGDKEDYLSKNQITENMIDYFINQGLNFKAVIFDAGFCSPDLLNYLNLKNIDFFCRFPKTRKVSFSGLKVRTDEVFTIYQPTDFYYYHKHGFVKIQNCNYAGMNVSLLGIAKDKDKLIQQKFFYILTNCKTVKAKAVRIYKIRWKIETLFKVLKSYLGLTSFNTHDQDSIIHNINFSISAFLVIQELSHKWNMTIYQSIEEIQNQPYSLTTFFIQQTFNNIQHLITITAF